MNGCVIAISYSDSMLSGIGFQFIWNNVPDNMEQHSKIAVTWRQLYSLGGRTILLGNVCVSFKMPKQVFRLAFQYLREIQGFSFARAYIIRCVVVWNEMVFMGRISNTQTYKPTLGQNNK